METMKTRWGIKVSFERNFKIVFTERVLLAPQSSALEISPHRDFHTNPTQPNPEKGLPEQVEMQLKDHQYGTKLGLYQ